MKILVPTLYNNAYGGSVRILILAKNALSKEFDVDLRASIPEANSKTTFAFPSTVDTFYKKLFGIFLIIKYSISEIVYLIKNKYDVIYVHDEPSLYLYGFLCKIFNIKLVWHVHMSEGLGILKKIRLWANDYRIYISNHIIGSGNTSNSFLVRYPITLEKFELDKNIKYKKYINIAIIGSICERKNQLLAIKILQKCNEINNEHVLYMYGDIIDKQYYNELISYIESNNLKDFVKYEGFKPHKDIYNKCDIILLTAEYESFGLTFVEGLYAGLPVVANNICSFREISDLIEYDERMIFSSIEEACNAIKNHASLAVNSYKEKIEEVFGQKRFENEIIAVFQQIRDRDCLCSERSN